MFSPLSTAEGSLKIPLGTQKAAQNIRICSGALGSSLLPVLLIFRLLGPLCAGAIQVMADQSAVIAIHGDRRIIEGCQ